MKQQITSSEKFEDILTPEAIDFLNSLGQKFNHRVHELLKNREVEQEKIKNGKFPDFLPETRHLREGDWKIAGIPDDIQDRRVEITGPVDCKMVINALNSGAKVFMADFEDSHSPTWSGTLEGQRNMRSAIKRNIEFTSPEGKQYKLNDEIAVLMVRPRGWHLFEKHFLVNDEQLAGGLFDFGLYFFHNVKEFLKTHGGIYFYLPKMESHLEARLWNDVFVHAQEYLGVPQGSVKATVLIETIMAAFEMDEILYELKDHIIGLNCGRWDYIFSFIKKFSSYSDRILPDRAVVNMTTHFMRSYSLLLIKTTHKRGAFAMGGMAAQIPIKNDPEANQAAFDKVRDDKLREVTNGHDGTWVAHPGLIPVAMEVFNEHMNTPNQIKRQREDVNITQEDLLQLPEGNITEAGLRNNISVGIQYIEAWLRGVGCVPIFNLMEDAATAEISRTQLWQWIKHQGKLNDGRSITRELFDEYTKEELDKIKDVLGDDLYSRRKFGKAVELFTHSILANKLEEFLTLSAYQEID